MKSNKTLAVTVRFFNDKLPEKVGGNENYNPCWTKGFAYMEANKKKGIKSCSVPFNKPEDIIKAINTVLRKSGVVFVSKPQ